MSRGIFILPVHRACKVLIWPLPVTLAPVNEIGYKPSTHFSQITYVVDAF